MTQAYIFCQLFNKSRFTLELSFDLNVAQYSRYYSFVAFHCWITNLYGNFKTRTFLIKLEKVDCTIEILKSSGNF